MFLAFQTHWNTFPVRYLRLPLGANPAKLSTWKPMLSTIRAKLITWKGKFFSMAMIKSILSSLSLYYMSVFSMPKGINKVITSINCSFLWKVNLNSHGICKVAWHKVIKSKSFNGLGLGSLHNKNLALLFKWLYNLDKGVAGGWQDLILRKYWPHFANGLHVFAGSLSPIWHGMISVISSNQIIVIPLQSNVEFKVGDRRNIKFWTDSWLGFATPLQLLFSRLYNLSLQQSISLVYVYSPTDTSLNLSQRRSLRPWELCMRESLIAEVKRGLIFFNGEDIKIWKFHSSDVYSVYLDCHFF